MKDCFFPIRFSMERVEATPAEPVIPARQEISVNQAAIDKLVRGNLERGEVDFAWNLIRRCKNWRDAYERALAEYQRDLLRRSMEG